MLLAASLAALAAPAFALNMNGLKEAPVTRLTGEELKAYRIAVMRALDELHDGMSTEWRAPKTRFTSKITPQRTFTEGKLRCREATIEADAYDRYQRGLYVLCKAPKGDWHFKAPATRTKAKARSK
jgi:surface antigen